MLRKFKDAKVGDIVIYTRGVDKVYEGVVTKFDDRSMIVKWSNKDSEDNSVEYSLCGAALWFHYCDNEADKLAAIIKGNVW